MQVFMSSIAFILHAANDAKTGCIRSEFKGIQLFLICLFLVCGCLSTFLCSTSCVSVSQGLVITHQTMMQTFHMLLHYIVHFILGSGDKSL